LKILQILPSLVQNYPTEARGDALATVLQICSALQNAKNSAVSNTAAATLQQLVIAVFDRVAIEDGRVYATPHGLLLTFNQRSHSRYLQLPMCLQTMVLSQSDQLLMMRSRYDALQYAEFIAHV
jgi:hypothetical protein